MPRCDFHLAMWRRTSSLDSGIRAAGTAESRGYATERRVPCSRKPGRAFALSWFYFDVEDQKPKASRRYETVEPWILRLERVAVGAQQWNFLGWYWAMREQPTRGLPFARRAIDEDSSCADCFDTLALLLYQSGSIANAVRAQRIAVNLSENAHPSVHERLKQFERSLVELKREYTSDGAADNANGFADLAALGDGCRRARPLSTPKPTYPSAAQMNDVEGVVHVKFVVREDGSVTDVTPIRGPALLIEAATDAVERWTFTPAQCDGRAAASVQSARLPFVLKDKARGFSAGAAPTPRR